MKVSVDIEQIVTRVKQKNVQHLKMDRISDGHAECTKNCSARTITQKGERLTLLTYIQ